MDNNGFLLDEDRIKSLIVDALYEHNLISKDIHEKCGKPSYISDLPGDLRSADVNELSDRLDAIDEEIASRQDMLKKAEYRIGVKRRDIERLEKRVNKHLEKIDKAEDKIISESDKIVKNITTLEDKVKKSDKDTDSLLSGIDRLKRAHNNVFEKEVGGGENKGYRDGLTRLSDANDNLKPLLESAYDDKIINKSDMNKGDISKNISNVEKQVDKIEKAYKDMDKDGSRMMEDAKSVEYIAKNGLVVQDEIDKLDEEYDATLQAYLDKGGSRNVRKEPPSRNYYDYGMAEAIDEMHRLRAYAEFGVKDLNSDIKNFMFNL